MLTTGATVLPMPASRSSASMSVSTMSDAAWTASAADVASLRRCSAATLTLRLYAVPIASRLLTLFTRNSSSAFSLSFRNSAGRPGEITVCPVAGSTISVAAVPLLFAVSSSKRVRAKLITWSGDTSAGAGGGLPNFRTSSSAGRCWSRADRKPALTNFLPSAGTSTIAPPASPSTSSATSSRSASP